MPPTQVQRPTVATFVPPQDRRGTPVERATSPRLDRLAGDVHAGRPEAVAEFWREVAEHGSPLVEPYGVGFLVTFCWRAPDAAERAVLLLANKVTDLRDPEAARLDQLAGTDVWHVTFRMAADWRATYRFAELDAAGFARLAELPPRECRQYVHEHAFPDPLNPTGSVARGQHDYVAASLVELPAAPPQPWRVPRRSVPRGELHAASLRSDALGEDRRVWVYGAAGRTRYAGTVIFLDGEVWARELPVLSALDTLVHAGQLPPLLAAFVEAGDVAARWRDLACHDPFVEFLAAELRPWLDRSWRAPTAASRTVLAGQSLGGLTAAYAGIRAPEAFGHVLAQSSSLWWPRGTSAADRWPDTEWVTHQVGCAPVVPASWYVEAGRHEWMLVEPHRRLRDAIVARGCEVTYTEYNGGHDFACWRGGLVDGLRALTSGWR